MRRFQSRGAPKRARALAHSKTCGVPRTVHGKPGRLPLRDLLRISRAEAS
jgi:hypothetical protein